MRLNRGDLNQMADQVKWLNFYGVPCRFTGSSVELYGGSMAYEHALETIWKQKISGWWNYDEDLFRYQICTEEEFDRALGV